MKQPISIFRYVHDSLSPYRWATSVLASILVALLFAGIVLHYRVSSDRQLIQSISPYLITLVESQDRPELLRVFQSISETQNAEILLIQDGVVLASSGDIAEMDRPFVQPLRLTKIFGIEIASDRIFTRSRVDNSVEIILFTPLWSSLKTALAIAAAAFISFFGIAVFSSVQLKKALRLALRPLHQLHEEIRSLSRGTALDSQPIGISELEEMRQTIMGTHVDLENAKDRLAEERAKKLNAESYKRLIHDLHNPVAALRQNVRILTDSSSDQDAKQEAMESVPRIADQILKQVAAAKNNLENQPTALREADIRACVQASIQQIGASLGSRHTKRIAFEASEKPIFAAHDPDLLQRAIINLLENGLEASREQVHVSVSRYGNEASITVSDDGPGMNESAVSLYLQGRGQSNKADRQAFGLASVNHIVRSHGGRVIYKQGRLGGASFEIRLGGV